MGWLWETIRDGDVSIGGRIVVGLVQVPFAVIVGAIAMPVIWFVARVLGLIPAMLVVFRRLDWLTFLGGTVFGALSGATAMAAIGMAIDE